MRITEIISVPRFLTEYDKESDIFDFSNILLNCNIRFNINDKKISYIVESDKINKEFIKFYLDKSYLNRVTGECKYEDETSIPQSIMNEIFEIKFEDDSKDQVKIKSYKNSILILESIN